jgi:putative tryptophan/tyrosine transport system substrate-binding protein
MKRPLLAALCSLILAWPAHAPEPSKIHTIGVITLGVPPSSPYMQAFRRGLRDHGHDARTVAIVHSYANGDVARLPALARELVRMKPSVIVIESAPAALAVARATKTVPIVMAAGTNPVSLGLAASLARPGGNLTGVTLAGAARTAKQLQLLKEALPAVDTVAVIYNVGRPGIEGELKEAQDTAAPLRLLLQLVPVSGPGDLDAAFDSLARQRATALVVIGDGMLLGNSRRIAELATKSALPAIFPEREYAEAGGLMAYGPDVAHNFLRAAALVDKILKGAKPADMPIEQPLKWGLVINIKTAKALSLTLPTAVTARADEIIE